MIQDRHNQRFHSHLEALTDLALFLVARLHVRVMRDVPEHPAAFLHLRKTGLKIAGNPEFRSPAEAYPLSLDDFGRSDPD